MSEEINDNVVRLFPGSELESKPDIEKIRALPIPGMEERQMEAMEAAMKFATIILESLSVSGFQINDEVKCKDLSLLLEAMSSYISKCYGFPHPLQPLAQQIFEIKKDRLVYLRVRKLKSLTKTETNENDDS